MSFMKAVYPLKYVSNACLSYLVINMFIRYATNNIEYQ